MATQTQSDDGRTDSKRFDADDAPFTAADLQAGDRIDPSLVASVLDAIGTTRSARPDAAETQLAEATVTRRIEDSHTAILVDGGTGVMARATRLDSQQAWTQAEADWTVQEVGTKVVVDDADVASEGDNFDAEEMDAAEFATEWANVVLQDRAGHMADYGDVLWFTASGTLRLHDEFSGDKVYATIALTD